MTPSEEEKRAQRIKYLSNGRQRISGVNRSIVLKKVLPLGPECQLEQTNCLCHRQAMWPSMTMNFSTSL